MPVRSTPPSWASASKIVTAGRRGAARAAAARPAGPPPTTASTRALGEGSASSRGRCGAMIGDPALEPADVDRAVELAPIAALHARRGADTAADPGERRRAGEHLAAAASPSRASACTKPMTSLPAGQKAEQGARCSAYCGRLRAPIARAQARGRASTCSASGITSAGRVATARPFDATRHRQRRAARRTAAKYASSPRLEFFGNRGGGTRLRAPRAGGRRRATKAPAIVVLTITTERVPMPCRRAIAVASTVARRKRSKRPRTPRAARRVEQQRAALGEARDDVGPSKVGSSTSRWSGS
jgi:hypothetical protein